MASMRKKKGHYYARFYDKHRSPKRKELALGTSRKDVARRKLSDLERQHREGTFDPWNPDRAAPERLTVEQAKKAFMQSRSHLRPKSRREYRSVIRTWQRRQLPATLNVKDVGESHLRPFVYSPDVKPATRAYRYRHLRAFLNWCAKTGHVEESPLDGVAAPKKGKKVPEFLTNEQLERLLRAVDADAELKDAENQLRDGEVVWIKDAVLLAVCSGLRRSEVVNLRWRDVDFDSGFLTVRDNEQSGHRTKSGDERAVPIAGEASGVLRRLHVEAEANRRGEPSGYVLRNQTGGQLSADYMSRTFKKYVRVAKLPDGIHFHSLRHTCASWLAQKGTPMRVIQGILGHASLSTTERYSHLQPDVMQAAMQETFG